MKIKNQQPITRDEAVEFLLRNWIFSPIAEDLPLDQAAQRVTAVDIFSQNTLPMYHTSKFDGIAVRSDDFRNGLPDTSNWVKGVEYDYADTGDDFSDVFDTVIEIEDISFDTNGKLCFLEDFSFIPGNHVNPPGWMIRKDDLLVKAGTRLTPRHLAVLAMGGIHQVTVIKKPKVVFIPTGNELIPIGEKPKRGQNIEANGIMIANYLRQWGADPVCYPIVKDNAGELKEALDLALETADIVLINGGSSKGKDDLNAKMIQEGASAYRHGIKAIPGRPVAIAFIHGIPVVNIPGPTVPAFLVLDWCVSPLIARYLGAPPLQRHKIQARLEQTVGKRQDYEQYFLLRLKHNEHGYVAESIDRHSWLENALLRPDALYVAPSGVSELKAGEMLEVELLHEIKLS